MVSCGIGNIEVFPEGQLDIIFILMNSTPLLEPDVASLVSSPGVGIRTPPYLPTINLSKHHRHCLHSAHIAITITITKIVTRRRQDAYVALKNYTTNTTTAAEPTANKK